MPGIITILDEEHCARVEALWAAMEREFGVPRGYPGALPHVSFHLAEYPDGAAAERVMAEVAARTAPFVLHTSGLGVFTGERPILYIPVARSPELASLHADLLASMRAAGISASDFYYEPHRWIPHITIAERNVPPEALPAVVAWLAGRDLSWQAPATNLALAEQTEDGAAILARVQLTGS